MTFLLVGQCCFKLIDFLCGSTKEEEDEDEEQVSEHKHSRACFNDDVVVHVREKKI